MHISLSSLLKTSSPFCLVIGNPIGHSLSPLLHNTAARYHKLGFTYYAVNIEEDDFGKLPELFSSDLFTGANITIPYKSRIREYLDDEDETARAVGAVNTILKTNVGQLKGYNTDVFGFTEALKPYNDRLVNKKAVLFGSGGASKAIVFGLKALGMDEIAVISRNPAKTATQFEDSRHDVGFYPYDEISKIAPEAELFVNATPLGMEPDVDTSPLPPEAEQYLAHKICYDIVYKPLKTRFLKQAENQGAVTISGLDMFIFQGAEAFELWTGKPFPYEIVKKELTEALYSTTS